MEDEGSDRVMLPQVKVHQRLPANQEKLRGENMEHGLSITAWAGTNPANTLILDFQTPELTDGKFLVFKLPSLWYQ